jgi:simple sugar transport system ATP-binding protein
VSNVSPKARIKKGFAFIPEDRLSMGLVPSMNLMENAILKGYDTEPYSRRGILNKKSIVKNTEDYISRYDIKNGGIDLPVALMSGGNQQKLLIAREISGVPKLIIAAYPVRGLDIGATEAIHKILMEQRNKGACIILISEELEELFEMADRIAVLNSGYLSDVFRVGDTSFDEIGSLMIGINNDNADQKSEIA